MGRKKGVPLSEEQKKKISERLKQYYAEHEYSEERRKKVSDALKGREFSEETKQRLSDAHKGKVLSDEHKEKIRERMIEAWERDDSVFQSNEYREKLKGKSSWNKGKKTPLQVRQKISIGVRKSNTPEVSRRRSQAMIRRYMNPENRKKTSEEVNRAYENEDLRKKLSDIQKLRYSDPKVRARQIEIIHRNITSESHQKQAEVMRGRKFTDKHLENLCKSARRGPDSNFWKGGTRKDNTYPIEFSRYLKRKIRIRDNQTCQSCFKNAKGWVGVIHHIDGNKQNCSEDNLILVCRTCHNAIHGLNTITNKNIEKYKELLKNGGD